MVKIPRKNILLFALLVLASIVISSCAKPECAVSSDCAARPCASSACEGGKCAYALQQNCCGNKLKESIESGKPGSQCTCPADYGKCEGKAKVKNGLRTDDAAYVHYYCNVDSQCVLGAEKKDVVPQNFLESISSGFFKASSIEKYNRPFDVDKDSFDFKITLEDASKDLVLPVKITNAKLLYNGESARTELLIADRDLSEVLNGIGDQAVISVPLTLSYRPQELEETGTIRYSIDYEFVKKVSSGKVVNGTAVMANEIVRSTFTAPSKPILLVRRG